MKHAKKLLLILIAVLLTSACTEGAKEEPLSRGIDEHEKQASVGISYTCPTGGVFKAMDPFTGKDVTLPESPMVLTAEEAGLIQAAAVVPGTAIILSSKGTILDFGDLTDKKTIDLGAQILALDIYRRADKGFYAIAGTGKDLAILPFTVANNSVNVKETDIIRFDLLGGIEEIKTAVSTDLSEKGEGETNTPPGMQLSMGEKAGHEPGDIDFIYLTTVSGDLWRAKLKQVFTGGCLEKLFAGSVGKIDVAGQYVAFLSDSFELFTIDLLQEQTFGKINLETEGLLSKSTDFILLGSVIYLPSITSDSSGSFNEVVTVDLFVKDKTVTRTRLADAAGVKPPTYMTIAEVKNKVFIRGEGGYLASANTLDTSISKAIWLESTDQGKPVLSLYNKVSDQFVTVFLDGLETLEVKHLEEKLQQQ